MRYTRLVTLVVGVCCALTPAQDRGQPWPRHTIDDSSRGADGVKLADANGDGLLDIVTGWEQGGVVRVCLNPGPAKAKQPWPAVTVGKAGSVEDAVFADLDADGALDVVSCCEGGVKTMFVHWAPADKAKYLDPNAWTTEPLPASQKAMMWMFCVPVQLDGKNGVDLVAGAKGEGAKIGWFESPPDPRNLAGWKWHPLRDAGWIMSLIMSDMDSDGDLDIAVSDRKGENRGCFWLDNPGPGPQQTQPWTVHNMGGQGKEVMFMTLADLDADKLTDALVAAKPTDILFLRRLTPDGKSWEPHTIAFPENTGTAKAVSVGDIDLDGKLDLVFTCEAANEPKSGVIWLSYRHAVTDATWLAHEISGPVGVKYDLVELLDLDADGDLDALTCEEARNLGVFWHENPR